MSYGYPDGCTPPPTIHSGDRDRDYDPLDDACSKHRNLKCQLCAERAAHLFGCFYTYRAAEMCREEGIREEQIERGAWLADQRREVRAQARIYYGDPAYGSWPKEAGEWMREELRKRGAQEVELKPISTHVTKLPERP